MWITHSYIGTTLGKTKCLFFLLFEDYLEAQRGLSEAVKNELERFARNLGDAGAVVMPFPGDAPTTRRHVLDKPWSEAELHEIRQTPAILMIDKDFDEFDPHRHPWVLFHFDRAEDATYAARFRSLLEKLTNALTANDGDAFALVRAAVRHDVIAKASKSFRVQPGAFGVSIDLRAAWDALKEYLRNNRSQSV
jgi:hypothetical protein